MTQGQIGLGSGRKGTLGSGSLPLTLSFQTWRQLWRVLEMSDIVLLITDIRHPVSTGISLGKLEVGVGGRFLWGQGQRQQLGDKEVSFFLPILSYPMLMSAVRVSVLYSPVSQTVIPSLAN